MWAPHTLIVLLASTTTLHSASSSFLPPLPPHHRKTAHHPTPRHSSSSSSSSLNNEPNSPKKQQEHYVADIQINPSQNPPPSHGIILIDPFAPCFSGYLSKSAISDYGMGVVNVYSPYSAKGIQRRLYRNAERQKGEKGDGDGDGDERAVDVENVLKKISPLEEDDLKEWLESIPFRIVAVLCETDSGLEYAERLSCAIDSVGGEMEEEGGGFRRLRHNGYCEARRDKYLMNEVCAEAGVTVVQQALCQSADEAVQKARELFGIRDEENENNDNNNDNNDNIPKAIIKPTRGVASDRINLCTTPSSIRTATLSILQTPIFGTYHTPHTHVILQQYVPGREYAIDVVSRDGEHKVAALWVYDKTSTDSDGRSNPFVYSCTRLVSADDDGGEHPVGQIWGYVKEVLDALGLRWGMTHNEVKLMPGGEVRLMEVNVRQHNTDFAPLCQACVGYDALGLCLAAYLGDYGGGGEDEFEVVPTLPTLRYNGAVVHLACFVEGEIVKVNHIDEIEQLESVVFLELYPGYDVGSVVKKTKDIRSDCGWIHLIHGDETQLMEDYRCICELMRTMYEVI